MIKATHKKLLDRACRIAGSQNQLALKLDVSHNAPSLWRKRGLPDNRRVALQNYVEQSK